MNRLWSFLDLKIPNIIDRRPVVLIDNGKILFNKLRQVQLPLTDLLMGLRQKKIWNLNVVHQAILEPTGEITAQKKNQYSPVTAKDMRIIPKPVINPPKIIYSSMSDLTGLGTSDFQSKNIYGYIINPDNSITYIKKG